METRYFDTDPLTGAVTLFHYDHATDETHLETIENHQALIDANSRAQNFSTRPGWQGDMHKVAQIPLSVWFKLKKEGVLDDQARLRAWLNSADNLKFRTRDGHV